MSNDIINPFKQKKKVDWAKISRDKLNAVENKKSKKQDVESPAGVAINRDMGKLGKLSKPDNQSKPSKPVKPKERVAKSFKIYKGDLSRKFDKRVNKMQVYFDDKDFDKNYVDSGKYIMFLMAFSEKYGLYDLYREVDGSGAINVSKQEILNNFAKHLKD